MSFCVRIKIQFKSLANNIQLFFYFPKNPQLIVIPFRCLSYTFPIPFPYSPHTLFIHSSYTPHTLFESVPAFGKTKNNHANWGRVISVGNKKSKNGERCC